MYFYTFFLLNAAVTENVVSVPTVIFITFIILRFSICKQGMVNKCSGHFQSMLLHLRPCTLNVENENK